MTRAMVLKQVTTLLKRGLLAIVCFELAFAPIQATAGDLNTEVNNMFNGLGTMQNYTAPGAFKGQVMNTYQGGSFYMRSPNKSYQLGTIAFPYAHGGCGGIDLFAGSFSHISGTELKNMLKNITAALPGVAFQVALDVLSPLLGSITKHLQSLQDMLTNKRIGSCETAVAGVSSAAEAIGFDEESACEKVANLMGDAADRDEAVRLCQTKKDFILKKAKADPNPSINNLPPLTGNLTWQMLKNSPAIDDKQREFIMNIVGSYIYRDPGVDGDAVHIAPKITSITKLLYGDADAAAAGDVTMTLWVCDEYVDCKNPSEKPVTFTPFRTLATNMMRSISSHIQTRTPLPNPSAEIGFVNNVSEPVYRMLSIGNAVPTMGMADVMIDQYSGVIAADYGHAFLEQNLRIGIAAISKSFKFSKDQKEDMQGLLQGARRLMTDFMTEKTTLYSKVQSYKAIGDILEAMERQLRTQNAQHVMDMLGFQAAQMTK